MHQKIIKAIKLSKYDNPAQSRHTEQSSLNGLSLTSLAVNQRVGRGHVAVGGKYGYLRIISLASEVSGAPVIDHKVQDITELCFSRFKHSLLAGSTESGIVALWDANAVKRTSTFSEHRAPATGLAFSPMNEMLLSSSGLDKRCFCYDVLSGKTAATIKTDEPLTCLDFHQDGTTIALGTSKGKIFVYDLRSTRGPSQLLEAHPGKAVKCLVYQPAQDHKVLSKHRSNSLLKQTSKKNMLSDVLKENLPNSDSSQCIEHTIRSPSFSLKKIDINPNSSPSTQNNSTDQLFSPLGGANANANTESNIAALSPDSKNASNLSNFSRLSNGSIFSPLRENSSNLSSSVVGSNPDSFSPTALLLQSGSKQYASPLPRIEETACEEIASFRQNVENTIEPVLNQKLAMTHVALGFCSNGRKNIDTDNSCTLEGTDSEHNLQPKEMLYKDLANVEQEVGLVPSSAKKSFQENEYNVRRNEKIMPKSLDQIHPKQQCEYTDRKLRKHTLSKNDKPSDQAAEMSPNLPGQLNSLSPLAKASYASSSTDKIPKLTASMLPPQSACNLATNFNAGVSDKDTVSDIKAMMMAFPEALNLWNHEVAAKEGYEKESSLKTGNNLIADIPQENISTAQQSKGKIQQFERNYLKSVVTECMDDFTSEVRKQLWHIEWDITKNFQLLKEENDLKQARFNKMYEDMMLDNQRLKEENETLKKSRHFFQQS